MVLKVAFTFCRRRRRRIAILAAAEEANVARDDRRCIALLAVLILTYLQIVSQMIFD
jgi:hypothetical protein